MELNNIIEIRGAAEYQSTEDQFIELADLELAVIAGGAGDVVVC
jgi:hypothetical protein